MNDIQIEKNNKVFNYRVAIIIKNKDKVLVQKDKRAKHYTLPGGRCLLGETSVETAIREFKEETGLDTIFVKEKGIIENFFTSSFNKKQYHEILIVHELKLLDETKYEDDVIKNIEIEKKENLMYYWVDIKCLEKINFKPSFLIKLINSSSFIHHINKD